MITASAPGKIILFGEHAVVHKNSKGEYNLGITAAIDKRTKVNIEKREDKIEISSAGIAESRTPAELKGMVAKINRLIDNQKFDELAEANKNDFLLPCFFVVGNIFEKYGYSSIKVTIDSKVPKSMGASSSSFTALTFALLKFLKIDAPLDEIANFANLGDKVAHGKTSGIDAFTVTYGYWNAYRQLEGVRRLDIDLNLPLLVVDTGKQARTSETVLKIMRMKETKPNFVNGILDKLDEISLSGLSALKSNDIAKVGKLMTDYYRHLSKLGISTKELDDIVDLALKNDALGAKPTGGWGGGCCLVLAKDEMNARELIDLYDKKGYATHKVSLGKESVRLD